MNTWILKVFTSSKPEGVDVCELDYDSNGIRGVRIYEHIMPNQAAYILGHLVPPSEDKFTKYCEATAQLGVNIELRRIVKLVSFEDFWKKWPKRVKRLRAEKVWAKMKDEDRLNAYNGIDKAYRNAQYTPVFMPNPDSYLADRRYEDELLNKS
jgi:uncharacterized protein (DUF1919 family)